MRREWRGRRGRRHEKGMEREKREEVPYNT